MLAGACVPTVSTDDEASTEDTSAGESGSSEDETPTSDTGPDTGTDTGSDTSSDTGTTSDTGTDTDTSTNTDTGADSETGTDTGTDTGFEEPPAGFCGLQPGPADPWIQLDQYGQILEPGATLELECGGQGSWMFRLDAVMGGFVPDIKLVPFDVTMDVEGYNIGPNGHFAEHLPDNWFLGCCNDDYEEYPAYCDYNQYITLFPPDLIEDMTVLHGLPATISAIAYTNEGDAMVEFDVTLWAVPKQQWIVCGYGYDPAPPLLLDIPIPLP